MTPPLLKTLAALEHPPYARAGLSTALLAVERVAVVGVTLAIVARPRLEALAMTAALGAIFAVRGAVTGGLRVRVRAMLHEAALDALLDGDVVRSTPLEDDDAHAAVHAGTHAGVVVLAEALPSMAGNALASLLLGAYLVHALPARMLATGGLAAVLAVVAMFATRRVTSRASERAWREYSHVFDDLLAAVGARLELIANASARSFRDAARARIERYRGLALRAERTSSVSGRAPMLAAALGIVGVLLVDRSLRGAAASGSLGDIAVFASVMPAFFGLVSSALPLAREGAALRPLAELLSSPRREEGGGAPVPALPAPITWDAVSYTYPEGGARPVLEDLSIHWSPGHVLLLAGPNGSGKSTCVRLLLGLARPQRGAVRVGGADLFSLDLAEWRRRIAYLPQRPFLPERATIRDAVRLVVPSATDADIRASLERVDVWSSLARQSDSPLDVRVRTLSAGQRQRVALARVLIKDAEVYVLDEPDANLDAAGIRLLAQVTRELAASRMVAVVAHTADIVSLGDTRVVLGSAEAPRG